MVGYEHQEDETEQGHYGRSKSVTMERWDDQQCGYVGPISMDTPQMVLLLNDRDNSTKTCRTYREVDNTAFPVKVRAKTHIVRIRCSLESTDGTALNTWTEGRIRRWDSICKWGVGQRRI